MQLNPHLARSALVTPTPLHLPLPLPPQRRESRVIIDLGDVLQHDPGMHRRILEEPRTQARPRIRLPPPVFPACRSPQVPVWEKYAQIVASEENPEFMNMKSVVESETETRKLHVGFEGQLGTHVRLHA